jgi:serine/threonine-protein kinase
MEAAPVRSTTRKTLTSAVIGERYRLDREMARGGMGTVWVGRDMKLGRAVAVKVLAKELAQMSEALARFQREALTVAQLQSSHIVQVFDYGLHEGLPYIVMELLEGENLGQRLKRLGRIPLAHTHFVVEQICKGLKAAHSAGLIHRDLKPSNIFMARRDDTEIVKLLDFGVVKALDPQMGSSEATSTGILLGTPQYMSPEQARATKDIDHRSDLWSVAVIAFRMLTGHNPFRGDSVGDVVLKICSDALPRFYEHAPDLPTGLDEFFDKAFARHPDDRYQSAVEMARSFQMLAAGPLPHDGAAPPISAMTPAPFDATTPSPMRAYAPSGVEVYSDPSMPRGIYEATPISTTVGGTPLASKLPPPPHNFQRQPVAVVIAGAAVTLVVVALVAVFWVNSEAQGNAPAADGAVVPVARMPIPEIEAVDEPHEEDDASPAPDEPLPEAPVAPLVAKPGKLDEDLAPRVKPIGSGKLPPSETSSGKGSRPDWGLGP